MKKALHLWKTYTTAFAILFLIGGSVLGFELRPTIMRFFYYAHNHVLKQIREGDFGSTQYQFINPLLACELATRKDIAEFIPLKDKMTTLINTYKSQGKLTSASVYFDTRDGRWLGINQGEKYFPASLMKVPLMIAFYKKAESDLSVLDQEVVYTGATNLNIIEYFKPKDSLVPGMSYSVDELIKRMIVDSDNNAVSLLLPLISPKELNEIYSDIGFSIPADTTKDLNDYTQVKSYASFFRILYNSSYLSREMSEKALGLLSQTNFIGGIRSSMPADITVAQKFGERDFGTTKNSTKELHDCGVIYYPNHPYLICIMTKGNDFDTLSKSISALSKIAYDYVDSEAKAGY